jgi:crotonobetainyl-CoA:carnitine CoA-transferase CaiB-like acyl-CoA transferase
LISYRIYETKDQKFVGLAALEEKFWQNFCRGVEREDWIAAHVSRATPENPVYLQVKELFQSRTQEEWSRFSREVDCCLTPVLEIDEVMQHPHVQAKGLAVVLGTQRWGDLLQMDTSAGGYAPGRGKSGEASAPPPAAGEHTEDVLQSVLSVAPAQIADWKRRGII